jgi:hypothetical protein
MNRHIISRVARAATPGATVILLFVTTLFSPFAASAARQVSSNTTSAESVTHVRPLPRVAEGYGSIPIHFEVNRGQAPTEATFVARGSGYSLSLTPSGPTLRLTMGSLAPHPPFATARPEVASTTLTIRFAGGNSHPEIAGLEPLPGRVNYFRGSDPSKWIVDVPTFAQVKYLSVYPGVDVLWYGDQREFEYDVIVAPGADPSAVRLDVSGARSVEIDPRGDLVLGTEAGQMTMRKPSLYQDAGSARRAVDGGYVLLPDHRIGFRVGPYDTSRPLVIDPIVAFSTFLGGTGFDQAYNVAVDAGGNAYVVGVAYTADFPTTPGALQTTPSGTDGFVTKLSADGSTFVYSTYLSGANCQGVAVDSTGSAYVTGYAAINFPTTPGAFQPSLRGGYDAFVTKLSPTGASLVYSTILGGSFDDFGYDIALDAGGNAYVTGNTSYRAPGPGDFPTVNAFQPAYGGGTQDAFVTKVNPTGTALVYSTYLGGGQIINATEDWGEGIAVDAAGSAYVTGETYSPDFPTTTGAYDRSRAGLDAFIVKFSPSGSSLVYSTFLGASGREEGLDIAVDASGNAYVAGLTESTDNPFTPEYDGFPTTPGAFQPRGSFDAFVTKLNPQGSGLVYSTYLGGPCGVDRAWGIAVDQTGNAYVVGDTGSQAAPCQGDFPIDNAVQPSYGGGLSDAFAAALNASGTALLYSTYLGGNLFDEARGVALSSDGRSAYVAGSSSSFDFATTPGAAQPFNAGGVEHQDDAVVVKISNSPLAGGSDTPGVCISGTNAWFLRNSNSSGVSDVSFGYGSGTSGWVPLKGDWDGDGFDTPGLYDPTTGAFFLKNANASGAADFVFTYGPGNLGWVPISGDWDGNGTDTVGLYAPASGSFFLTNTNAAGNAALVFSFGPGGAGWVPLCGDWDGDGDDTIGVYYAPGAAFFLKNANASGGADTIFSYGAPNAVPLSGDWDGSGADSIGIYLGGTGSWFLRNSNAPGAADYTYSYGPQPSIPLVGDWDSL